MPKKTLCPTHLNFQPRPTYPYAPGTAGGGFVFTAGQVAWDETGEVTGVGDVVAQTEQTLHNVLSVLAEGGASPEDVLKCTVYFHEYLVRCHRPAPQYRHTLRIRPCWLRLKPSHLSVKANEQMMGAQCSLW